jgi:hypothetical protein
MIEEIERQWHNKYAMKKIPKPSEFDSWWIKFKKWGKWGLILFMLIGVLISFEYCRKQYNSQFKRKIAIEMLFMKHRWEHHIDRDLTN